MLRKISSAAVCVLVTTPAFAGGWETGRLGTSFLYEDGNYVELSYGSLNYSVNGTQSGVTHPMAKDQTRSAVSGKFQLGNLHVGLTSFGSGAIQMDGQSSSASPSLVPSANVSLNTRALLGRYSFNENFSVIAGVREVQLRSSTVTTLAAGYTIDSTSKSGMVYGASYELPQYAFRVELLRSEGFNMGVTGGATSGANSFALSSASGVSIPDATTLNFQTGIAEDTLLMASAHMVNWQSSQVIADLVSAPPQLNLASNFSDTTAYSLGLGRALSENTSASVTYAWEEGSGSSSGSAFTMSNGSRTLSVGVNHNIDAVSLSAGLSYTQVGDVTVDANSMNVAYRDNSVTALGIKIGYRF
jgi:hypothetical protein